MESASSEKILARIERLIFEGNYLMKANLILAVLILV